MKYLPLVWCAIWRNPAESLLTLLALSTAFALFGSMLVLNAAYEKAVEDARMDRLFVVCRFDCGGIPLGYREQIARISGVMGVSGEVLLGGQEQDPSHQIVVTFVDDGMRLAWPELPMTRADWRDLETMPAGVFLTRTAAARRSVKIGGILPMTTKPGSRADGGSAWPFTVLGVIDDPPGWGQWSPDLIVGNLHYKQALGRLDEQNVVNVLRVAIDRADRAREVCRQIEARYTNATPALFCVPARMDAEELAAARINMRQISLGIAAAGLFMILLLCSNGIAESVRERLPQLAILKTLGYSDAQIARLVFLEAAIPTILAAVLGGLLTRGVSAAARHLAVQGVIRMPPMYPSVAAFAWALAAALLIALMSSVAPLQRVRRMDLVSVLWGR